VNGTDLQIEDFEVQAFLKDGLSTPGQGSMFESESKATLLVLECCDIAGRFEIQ
jgi:hypothetical protein